jgi:ferredoxin
LKFDELAEYVIDRGFGRKMSKTEAQAIIDECEDRGLVHLTDNAQADIQVICNCCSCCCWSLTLLRRQKIPRDVLMAIYNLRQTDLEQCTGCAICVDLCPLGALSIEDDAIVVNENVCIGCGVCINACSTGASNLVRSATGVPPTDFRALHRRILEEQRKVDSGENSPGASADDH